jgi:hypothetical protein
MNRALYIVILFALLLRVSIAWISPAKPFTNSFFRSFGNKETTTGTIDEKQLKNAQTIMDFLAQHGSGKSRVKDEVIDEIEDDYEDDQYDEDDNSNFFKAQEKQSKTVLTRAKPIQFQSPIEFIHNGQLKFGNFLEYYPNNSTAVLVQVSTGQSYKIDISQIIAVWDELADDSLPTSPSTWADIATEAMEILRTFPPRKVDLTKFYTILIQQLKNIQSIDSFDLGIFLFQERKFVNWMNPIIESFSSKPSLQLHALTAAQRYVAAILLFAHQPIYFKRKISKIAYVEDAIIHEETTLEMDAELLQQSSIQSALTFIFEGGYEILKESIKLTKEIDIFIDYYLEQIQQQQTTTNLTTSTSTSPTKSAYQATSFVHQNLIVNIIRKFELLAISRKMPSSSISSSISNMKNKITMTTTTTTKAKNTKNNNNVEEFPQIIKLILKRLNYPLQISSVLEILMQLGYATNSNNNNNNNNNNQYGIQFYNRTITTSASNNNNNNNNDVNSAIQKKQRLLANPSTTTAGTDTPSASTTTTTMTSIHNLTPWTEEILQVTEQLLQHIQQEHQTWQRIPISQTPGKRNNAGKKDYRLYSSLSTTSSGISSSRPLLPRPLPQSRHHLTFAIDQKNTQFYDDCFTIIPEQNQLLIHITDVAYYLNSFPQLQQLARDRLQSFYLPEMGPLHMLPPQALSAIALSTRTANHVITVALTMNFTTGDILETALYPSIIGPITVIRPSEVDEWFSSSVSSSGSAKPPRGVVPSLYEDILFACQFIVPNLVTQYPDILLSFPPFINNHPPPSSSTNNDNNAHSLLRHLYEESLTVSTMQPSTWLVHAFLYAYAQVTYAHCVHKQIPTPLLWEHRISIPSSWISLSEQLLSTPTTNSSSSSSSSSSAPMMTTKSSTSSSITSLIGKYRIKRFASSPLRHAISLLQQQQVRATMGLELAPLPTPAICGQVIRDFQQRKKELSQYLNWRS